MVVGGAHCELVFLNKLKQEEISTFRRLKRFIHSNTKSATRKRLYVGLKAATDRGRLAPSSEASAAFCEVLTQDQRGRGGGRGGAVRRS